MLLLSLDARPVHLATHLPITLLRISTLTRIEDTYVDGVVITRGTEKEHIWTFAASISEQQSAPQSVCPCTDSLSTASIPSFVGHDYFCETGITGDSSAGLFYPEGDPLWDGEDCGSGSTCCELHNPPYFCKSLQLILLK